MKLTTYKLANMLGLTYTDVMQELDVELIVEESRFAINMSGFYTVEELQFKLAILKEANQHFQAYKELAKSLKYLKTSRQDIKAAVISGRDTLALSDSGKVFRITTKHRHWTKYAVLDTTGVESPYFVDSIAEIKEWLSLN